MFMHFVGMGIGHQDSSTNTSIFDSMNCDLDACEESKDYVNNKIKQGESEDMNEDKDEDDVAVEDEGEEESEDKEKEEDQDNSEDDIGYDDL